VIETLDPLTGAKVTRQYDAGGRVTQETNAAGLTTLYDFCSCGSPSAITQIVNGVERKTTYTYFDNNVTITDPLGRKTTTIVDENYMPIQTILPGGKTETASYLFDNNLQEGKDYPTRLVDIGGNDRNYTYDSLGRLKTSTNLGSNTYSFNYGDDGLTEFISPTGEKRQYEYNALGSLSKTIFEDGSSNTLNYNAQNRLDRVTLASGSTLGYQYDTAGRLTSQTATVGGTTSFTYNGTGGFSTVSNASGTNTYSYDASDRVTNIVNPNGSSIGYHYDLVGRVDRITEKANPTATARVTEYGYDILGNQTSVKDAAGRITLMSYDAVNRLVEKTLPNGVKTVYVYNDLDQVSKIETKNGAGTVLSSLTYERTGIGEPTKVTREDGSFVTYGYDGALRLTRESYFGTTGTLQSEISYTYDASGKRLTKNSEVYAYNNGYQLQGVTGANGAETYGYDADGRVSTINRDGGTLNLSHDNYDRLTQANGTSYLYDGEGRRIRAVSGADERRFLQASNGGLDVTELLTDASGNVISDYVYGNGSVPISRLDASGNPIYYLTDAMGSVIGEVDGDGNVVSRFSYDAFGNVRSQSGLSSTTTGGDFRFQGQWLESDSGLYYFRARDYDAKTGLFLSRDAVDPIQENPESANPYQFAYQNPNVYSDPSGMFNINEVSVSNAIINALQGIRNYSVQQIKDFVKDGITEYLGGAVFRVITDLIPIEIGANKLQPYGTDKRPSTQLEIMLVGAFCSFFKDLDFVDNIYFGVPLSKSGKPLGNGSGCKDIQKDKSFPNPAKGLPTGTNSADYLFKLSSPKDNAKDGLIIGDFKLGVDDMYKKYITKNDVEGQLKAINDYAKRYQIVPVTAFITYEDGSQNAKVKLKRASIKQGVAMFIKSLEWSGRSRGKF
jgi:RHS repeat-associated protein